jgi:hypothetical protein
MYLYLEYYMSATQVPFMKIMYNMSNNHSNVKPSRCFSTKKLKTITDSLT